MFEPSAASSNEKHVRFPHRAEKTARNETDDDDDENEILQNKHDCSSDFIWLHSSRTSSSRAAETQQQKSIRCNGLSAAEHCESNV